MVTEKICYPINKKRVEEIDILKGIGIFFMVAGHSGAPFTHFVYLFHMAIFFIASGFFFKDKVSDSFKGVLRFIISKIKSLWFPFVFWNSIYVLLHNAFLKIYVYTNDPAFLVLYPDGNILQDKYTFFVMLKKIIKSFIFLGREQLSGAFWFLSTLFTISVLYCFLDFLIKRICRNNIILLFIQFLLSIVFLLIGFYCYKHDIRFFSIDRVLSCYGLYFLGHVIAICREKFVFSDRHYNTLYFIMLVLTFIFLLILCQLGTIELSSNLYTNPVFLIVCSITGWYFMFSLFVFDETDKFFKDLF